MTYRERAGLTLLEGLVSLILVLLILSVTGMFLQRALRLTRSPLDQGFSQLELALERLAQDASGAYQIETGQALLLRRVNLANPTRSPWDKENYTIRYWLERDQLHRDGRVLATADHFNFRLSDRILEVSLGLSRVKLTRQVYRQVW